MAKGAFDVVKSPTHCQSKARSGVSGIVDSDAPDARGHDQRIPCTADIASSSPVPLRPPRKAATLTRTPARDIEPQNGRIA
jgi:hypothetical protein